MKKKPRTRYLALREESIEEVKITEESAEEEKINEVVEEVEKVEPEPIVVLGKAKYYEELFRGGK